MPTLKSATTTQLLAEIARREKGATKIQAQRDKLAKEIAKLDAELAMFGAVSTEAPRHGRPPGSKNKAKGTGRGPGRPASTGKRRRATNDVTLPDALAAAITAGTTVSPLEAAAAVKKAGYKSFGKTFNQQVASALAKDKGFKKLGRGSYQRVG